MLTLWRPCCGSEMQDLVQVIQPVQEYAAEVAAERRDLHNEIVDLKGAVRVVCRQRPRLDAEVQQGWPMATHCDEVACTIDILNGRYAPHPMRRVPAHNLHSARCAASWFVRANR
jgi:hypothetical protein